MNKKLSKEQIDTAFEFYQKLFDSEVSRIELIEKKAQFQLTLFTIFLGAIFLKIDKFSDIYKIISAQQLIPIWLFNSALSISFIALFLSLVLIFIAMRIRKWDYGIPPDTYKYLFDENFDDDLLKKLTKNYYVAWDYNKAINNRKAGYIKISSTLLITAIFFQFCIIFLIGYISLKP